MRGEGCATWYCLSRTKCASHEGRVTLRDDSRLLLRRVSIMHVQGEYYNRSIDVLQRINRGPTTYIMKARTKLMEIKLPDYSYVIYNATSVLKSYFNLHLKNMFKPCCMWGRHTRLQGGGI